MVKKAVFCVVFVTIISLPVLMMAFGEKDASFKNLQEEFADLNSLSSFKTFIIKGRRYFLNNYKTKNILYSSYKKNVSDKFSETPSVSNVLLGKENWMFIGDTHNNAFSEAKGVLSFTNSELKKIKGNIELCKRWCEQNNIQLYITIPPGKHTVYKEFLPYNFPNRKTKLDQLISVENEVIDLRNDLLEGKQREKEDLYFKTDTHWNELGALYGYQGIMKAMKHKDKGIEYYKKEDLLGVDYENHEGDVLRILGGDEIQSEKSPVINLKSKLRTKIESSLEVPDYHRFDKWSYEVRYKNLNAPNQKKIMFLRDSFSTSLIKYFSESFKEALFIYNPYFDKELIRNEKPDILVYEITERFLDRLLTIHKP